MPSIRKNKIGFPLGALLLLWCVSCAPCRDLFLESSPPGAQVCLLVPSVFPREVPREDWKPIGRTPMTIPSCRASEGILARLDGEELFYPAGEGGVHRLYFDFIQGKINSSPVNP